MDEAGDSTAASQLWALGQIVVGQRLRCCIAEAFHAIEFKTSLVLGKCLRGCIAQARQATEVKSSSC